MSTPASDPSPPTVSVRIGRWAVAGAPTLLRTLLGSCVAIILHDGAARIGGLAHVVLPESLGRDDGPGKYADTAIPALIADLDRLRSRPGRARPSAMLVGGASMFRTVPGGDIGRQNLEAASRILDALGIPVVARDAGGSTGRNVTLDTGTGAVRVRIPGGESYDLPVGATRPAASRQGTA